MKKELNSLHLINGNRSSYYFYTLLCFSCTLKRNTCAKIGAIEYNGLYKKSNGILINKLDKNG